MTFVCREPIADKGCLVMAWNQWSSETETDAADGKGQTLSARQDRGSQS